MTDAHTRAELLAALEAERAALVAVLARIDESQWRAAARADGWTVHDIAAHIADSTYGLALLALGEAKTLLPLDPATGWMAPDQNNAERREKNADLPREKVMSRLENAYATARRAVETVPDLDAAGPYGDIISKRRFLTRIIEHTREHRGEIEAAGA